MTRERLQMIGWVLGINVAVTGLFLAGRVWLTERSGPTSSASAAPMLLMNAESAAELFPPLHTYRPEIWGTGGAVSSDASRDPISAENAEMPSLMPPLMTREIAAQKAAAVAEDRA